MPPPTFRNLPADKQEHILNEALSEFAEHGYGGRTSVNSLVARLGISNGPIFQIFPRQTRALPPGLRFCG